MTTQPTEAQIDDLLDALYDHTLNGDEQPVIELTQQGLDWGMDPLGILSML